MRRCAHATTRAHSHSRLDTTSHAPHRLTWIRAHGTHPTTPLASPHITADEECAMTKGKETKKDPKKKAEKTLMEKRAVKKAKKNAKG